MKNQIFVIVAIFGLNGCSGNWHSIKHEFQVSGQNPSSVSIDAKQRVVLASSGEVKNTTETLVENIGPDGKSAGTTRTITSSTQRLPRICAEPSPDAMTALAQGLSGSGDVTGQKLDAALKLQGAYTSNETAAYVGLRTQTIQLLRDGMYRLCEGYMDGSLSGSDFNQLHRRYQILMMGLLSIEQLTGAVVAPQIAISSGAASASQNIDNKSQNHAIESYAQSQMITEKSEKEQSDLITKIKSENEVLSGLDPKSPEYAAKAATIAKLEADKVKKTDEVTLNKKKEEAYKYAIGVAMNTGASASVAEGTAKILHASKEIQTANFKEMADTVYKIVDATILQGFNDEDCYIENLRQATLKEQQKVARSCTDKQLDKKEDELKDEKVVLENKPKTSAPESNENQKRILDLQKEIEAIGRIKNLKQALPPLRF